MKLSGESVLSDILKPLILETAQNNILLQRRQTGPAKRNDLKTLKHIIFIGQNQSTIYKIITQSIQDTKSVKKHNNERHHFYFRR
jgi:hypothetical protein